MDKSHVVGINSLPIPTFKKGHRSSPSQVSNTFSTTSDVSCVTTVSMVSIDGLEEELVDEVIFQPSLPESVKVDTSSNLTSRRSQGLAQEQDDKEEAAKIPGEPLKTLLAAFFLAAGFLTTTVSLAFLHDRVPETEPLPDLFLDHVKYKEWGLHLSEFLLVLNTLAAFLVVILHCHRTIILRRIFLILGLLYFYRALTMCVTVLPKADPHAICLPKIPPNETSALVYFERVRTIISGGGLMISGKHVLCGDYIFSGHTMTFAVGYLAIKQYSPAAFVLLHRGSFVSALLGVILLLLGRGHYTIDVLAAYFVSTRLWWLYHTLAHNDNLKSRGPHNQLTNMWWWSAFTFFEAKTTSKELPNQFNMFIPARFKQFLKSKFAN